MISWKHTVGISNVHHIWPQAPGPYLVIIHSVHSTTPVLQPFRKTESTVQPQKKEHYKQDLLTTKRDFDAVKRVLQQLFRNQMTVKTKGDQQCYSMNCGFWYISGPITIELHLYICAYFSFLIDDCVQVMRRDFCSVNSLNPN